MRIAGNTLRRNYLNNYESARSARYASEHKIQTNRQYDRASQDPIKAARALRVRETMAKMETYQVNLKSAHSIYAMAEASLDGQGGVSEQIALVYEKLIEGAHETRNQGDRDIIAMDVEQKAEQMIGLMNVATADRKIFGGTNNTTVAYEIKGSENGKYVTYNGVPVNSSRDPLSFPYSEMSYLDIGIGMTTDESTRQTARSNAGDYASERIEDQTALPITFNGAKILGCGVTNRTVKIDLDYLKPGAHYAMDVSVGGLKKEWNSTAATTSRRAWKTSIRRLPRNFSSRPRSTSREIFSTSKTARTTSPGSMTTTTRPLTEKPLISA